MAERIKARIGDTVETTFNLAYKKAEVARLPNSGNYQAIDFFMFCHKGNKVMVGADREFSEARFIRCQTKELTQDDQPIAAQFYFMPLSKVAGRVFAVGEVWQLYLNYCAKDGGATGETKDPDSHLLAEVELTDGDPAPAKGG